MGRAPSNGFSESLTSILYPSLRDHPNKENEIKVEVKDIQLGSGVGRAKTYLQILNPMLPHDATLLHLCMVRSL